MLHTHRTGERLHQFADAALLLVEKIRMDIQGFTRSSNGEKVLALRPMTSFAPNQDGLKVKERLLCFDREFPNVFLRTDGASIKVAVPILVRPKNDVRFSAGIEDADDLSAGSLVHTRSASTSARNSLARSFRSALRIFTGAKRISAPIARFRNKFNICGIKVISRQ